MVEKVLVENGHYQVAKAYITYRKRKEEIRNKKNKNLGYLFAFNKSDLQAGYGIYGFCDIINKKQRR
ncbi:MAG: hypothetical protein ACP5SD_09680 [Elusimicrobiales bacterium]